MAKIIKKERTEVLLEEQARDIKVILEYTSRIPAIEERLDGHDQKLEKLQVDVDVLKVGQKTMQEDVKDIKRDLKNNVSREEFEKHEHRIARSL